MNDPYLHPKPARQLEELGIWRLCNAGSEKVFAASEKFPDIELECEKQGVAYQVRRSAMWASVHLFAAWKLWYRPQRSRFYLREAAKWVFETLGWLDQALERGYMSERQNDKLFRLYSILYYRLRCLVKNPRVWRKVFLRPKASPAEDTP